MRQVIRFLMHLTILMAAIMGFSMTQADNLSQHSKDVVLDEPSTTKDPYQHFNRAMFAFNDNFLDRIIFKPAATLYNKIMPKPLNRGVHNFFKNLNNLPTIANDILQFHLYQATSDLWRLGINSTLGIGGLFDVAEGMGLHPYSNDFGLTMARYGYKHSNYLVLPFFGPNTVRDGIAIPVDYYGFSIYSYIGRPERYALLGLGIVDWRAQLLKYQSVMEEVAVDKYAFQRDAYLQRRAYQIQQNEQLSAKTQLSSHLDPEIDVDIPGFNTGS